MEQGGHRLIRAKIGFLYIGACYRFHKEGNAIGQKIHFHPFVVRVSVV